MTPTRTEQTHEVEAMDTAVQWVLRLRDESLTEEDIGSWLQWYESDERNRKAFDETQEFWHLTGALASGAKGAERLCLLKGSGSSQIFPSTHRRWTWVALAASVLSLAVFSLRQQRPPADNVKHTVGATAAPLIRETLLSDGSRIELAAQSSVTVRYSERQRVLALRGGEAYFSVAPDRNRPFIVEVGHLRVRAVGTAFNIRRAGERVVVTVDKGTVEVYSTDGAAEADARDFMRVNAGNEIKWDREAARPVVTSVDPARELGWREGRLEYINEPLSAVIADVNRYAVHPIVIGDQATADLAFTGTVFANSVEEWLQALPGEFPVNLVLSDGTFTLTDRSIQH